MKRKRQNKLSKYMRENYSIEDLENYKQKKWKANLTAINDRIKELKTQNEKFTKDLLNSSLFKLAVTLLAKQPNYKKIFTLSLEERIKREENKLERHLRKRELTKIKKEQRKENKEWDKLLKHCGRTIDIIKNGGVTHYFVKNPALLLLTMMEIVDRGHDKLMGEYLND